MKEVEANQSVRHPNPPQRRTHDHIQAPPQLASAYLATYRVNYMEATATLLHDRGKQKDN